MTHPQRHATRLPRQCSQRKPLAFRSVFSPASLIIFRPVADFHGSYSRPHRSHSALREREALMSFRYTLAAIRLILRLARCSACLEASIAFCVVIIRLPSDGSRQRWAPSGSTPSTMALLRPRWTCTNWLAGRLVPTKTVEPTGIVGSPGCSLRWSLMVSCNIRR